MLESDVANLPVGTFVAGNLIDVVVPAPPRVVLAAAAGLAGFALRRRL